MTDPGKDDDRSLLDHHWPFAVSILAITVLCFVYFSVYSKKPTAWQSLSLAIIPAVAASLLIASALYVLLNRDFRAIRSTQPQSDLRQQIKAEIETLTSIIQRLSDNSGVLKRRAAIPTLPSMFDGADTISIAAVSALGLVNHHRGLLEEQLRFGKKLRVILLDADRKDALDAWDRLSNPPMNTPESDIRSSIHMLRSLAGLRNYPGTCDVRLLDTSFPYSLIICNKPSISEIQVELHAYRRAPEDRPNILLTNIADPHWFRFFTEQFEQAWANAKPSR
ncbi:MAG TPA: hypothetical protein VNF47_08005 [Streptosporangiaceae bacterium]|nr:hypothetical protein [Streptosporangiaceae bacterium]